MGNISVRIDSAAARKIMNSQPVQDDLLKRADAIRDRADSIGSGKYQADVRPGKNRAHAMIKTTDIESRASNAKHNALLKSMDAGRG